MGSAKSRDSMKEKALIWLRKAKRILDWSVDQIYPWILIAYGINVLLYPEKQYVLDLMTAIVLLWIFVTTAILIISDLYHRA
jgi:hypothetical protein